MEHLSGDFRAAIQRQVEEAASHHRYHSITLPGLGLQSGIVPEEALFQRIAAFGVEDLLPGSTVLDVGAASGWNAFWCERKGARVTALDNVRYWDFLANREALGSQVRYLIGDLANQTQNTIGTFDITICFGVLYHSRHPLKALEALCSVTRKLALIESFVIDPPSSLSGSHSLPTLLEFYPGDQLGGQLDNWTGPTAACLEAFVLAAGFCRYEIVYFHDRRLALKAFRQYPSPSLPADAEVLLSGVVSNLTKTLKFRSTVDEFLEIYFRCPPDALEKLLFEIDGYGLPIQKSVLNDQGEGQALARLPDWVQPGKHHLTIRRADHEASGSVPFVRESTPVLEEILQDSSTPARISIMDSRGFELKLEIQHFRGIFESDHTRQPALLITIGVLEGPILLSDGAQAFEAEHSQPGLDGTQEFRFRIPLSALSKALFAIDPNKRLRSAELTLTGYGS